MIKGIDHIAIAVKSIDKEVEKYRDILGFKFLGIEVVEEQKVKVAFFDIGRISIELIEPISEDSPVSIFLKKKGEGIHHIAYEVDDIKSQIEEFEKKDIKVLNMEPERGSRNTLVSFIHPRSFSGVLIELIQK